MRRNYDIVVGIPSFNEADNIAFVAKQLSLGISKYFPEKNGILVNVDNHSPDGTKLEFKAARTQTIKKYISTPLGVRGKGNNLYNLLLFSKKVHADSIMVVDADIRSVTQEWVKYLLDPVYDGYDFVNPLYSRHKYDGTITNNICYPIVYGLFGVDMRQPIGGDFAFSGRMNDYFLRKGWDESTRQFGIDIFMSAHAIFSGYDIAVTGLGSKVHKPSAPKLGAMFSQVVRTLFTEIIDNQGHWMKERKVKPLPRFGLYSSGRVPKLSLNTKKMKDIAEERYREYRFYLRQFLTPKVFLKFDSMADKGRFDIDQDLWARAVFDMITSFAKTKDKGVVIESLKALYFYRTASFVDETIRMGNKNSEKRIVDQAKCFWKKRGYLIRSLRGV